MSMPLTPAQVALTFLGLTGFGFWLAYAAGLIVILIDRS